MSILSPHASPDTVPVDPITLSSLLRPVRKAMLLATAGGLVGAALSLLPTIGLTAIADALLTGQLTARVAWTWFGIIAAGVFLSHLVLLGSTGYAHIVEGRFRHGLRRRIAHHIGRLPLGWHTEESSGKVHTIISEDVTKIHTIIAHFSTDFGYALGTPIFATIFLATRSWLYALLVFVWVILVFAVLAVWGFIRSSATAEQFMSAEKTLAASTVELVDGIAAVKTFGNSGSLFTRFATALDDYTESAYQWMGSSGRIMAIVQALFSPAGMLVPVLCIGVGLHSVGYIEAATIIPFILLGVSLPGGLLNVSQLFHLITLGNDAATRLGEILSLPELPEASSPRPLPNPGRAPSLSFEDVSFRYSAEAPDALSEVSLEIAPGTITAIVGPSGSGKSTLVRLLARFWDVTQGRICLNGVDIRDLSSTDLLSTMSVLLQESTLLHASVWDNIRLGKPDASDEEVMDAARHALIHDRIMELPSGYDTILGGSEGHLSGGEKQRIALARAFLSDAPLLLLDEATSHTDPHSERLIQRALSELARDRSVIVIAHRLSTVEDADMIVVLEGGRIVEQGTHEQLLARGGVYRGMWEAQQ